MPTVWTKELDEKLSQYWCQADPVLSAPRIGALLNVTKNAVIGRARRLKLPGRPSPIKATKPRSEYKVRLKPGPKPRPATAAPKPGPSWRGAREPQPPAKLTLLEKPDPATLVAGVGGSRRHCQFIPDDPDAERTLYCGKPPVSGKAYCDWHARACFTVRPPHKERVA